METANQRLIDLRKSLQYKQGEFAAMLAMKQGSYSDVERGRVGVSSRLLNMLSERFNVNPDWIQNGEDPKYMTHTPKMADRIKDVMNHYRLNYIDFAIKLGFDTIEGQRLSAELIEGREPSMEIVNAVCRAFPDVRRKYLVSGEGNVVNGASNLVYTDNSSEVQMLREQVDLYKRMINMYEEQVKRLTETYDKEIKMLEDKLRER